MTDDTIARAAPGGADTALADTQPVLTPDQIYAGLWAPGFWAGQTITYSIPTAASTWPGYADGSEPFAPNHFTALTAVQAARFADAMKAWDDLIAPHFVQTDDLTATGQIRVGFSDDSSLDGWWGYGAYPPIGGVASVQRNGDIWINAKYAPDDMHVGSYDFEAMLHEIGHTLGLKHPFEDPLLPAAYDNRRYTVMSYTDPVDQVLVTVTQYSPSQVQGHYTDVSASTPMVLDVAAIQARYGADPATAAGDTVYRFDPAQAFFKTIYDAGGNDTLDLSNLNHGSNVDLTPGAYSSIGLYSVAQQIADLKAIYPNYGSFVPDLFSNLTSHGAAAYTGANNLGIAFSTTIENVAGSPADDTVTGNDANNGIWAGAGNDSIRGLNGDDLIDGGAGNDDLNGNQGQDSVYGGDGADWVRGGQGNDTVSGGPGDDPHVNGNIGDDLVLGGAGNDTVYGGQGADTLWGEDGNDLLSGDLGNDVLIGGTGQDVFQFRKGAGVDLVMDFHGAEGDRVQLPTGTAYTLSDQGGQLVIDLGGGDQLDLAGVSTGAFGNWIIFA